jgi:formate/nitrite transporter
MHDLPPYLGVGFSKFLGGVMFSVGLILVVIGGAELFTGNNLIMLPCLQRTPGCTVKGLIRNWVIVYIGNFVGAMLLVLIIFGSGLYKTTNYNLGVAALSTAASKVTLSFTEALCRGIACNWLVCLAVWLSTASDDVTGKIFAIFFPITAFVASGFEHSIANMFFIPMGLFLKDVSTVVEKTSLNLESLTWNSFLFNNLLPVTMGNIIGGAFFVGTLYWYVYLSAAHKNV